MGKKNYVERTLAYGAKARQREYKQRVRRDQADRQRQENYRAATNRPSGELEAGNTWVDGRPAYYEDGGQSGIAGQRDRYYGPNGPFGPDHVHDISYDDGETWQRGAKG